MISNPPRLCRIMPRKLSTTSKALPTNFPISPNPYNQSGIVKFQFHPECQEKATPLAEKYPVLQMKDVFEFNIASHCHCQELSL